MSDEELADHYAYPERSQDRCWIRANFVATLDGAAQGPDRHSGSLSSPADRRVLALLRALADVILVGAGTVRAEQYGPATLRPAHARLRAERGSSVPPPIAVVSRSLDIPDQLLRDPRTLIFTPASADPGRRAKLADRVEVILAGEHDADLRQVIEALQTRGYTSILTEGGPCLFAELARAGLLDELCLAAAPLVLGGDALRITHGEVIETPPEFDLAGLLEDEGYLFGRWVCRG